MPGEDRREKRYVEVISRTSVDGIVTPLEIVWDDGRHFEIDRITEKRQAASRRTGGTGFRFTIRVGGQVTYLYYEGPRWFVEAKAGDRVGDW